MVPRSLFGLVIGPGGSHIKAIQAKTGAKVVMPDQVTSRRTYALSGGVFLILQTAMHSRR